MLDQLWAMYGEPFIGFVAFLLFCAAILGATRFFQKMIGDE